jgi:Flp pilus assembly protein TadD
LQLAPANAAWWAAMSVSLAAAGRHENAREALLRARSSEPVAPELMLWIDQRLRASARGLASAN